MFWGYSPALNLYDELNSPNDAINVLLVNTFDPRHILKTLANHYKFLDLHPSRTINMYVSESLMEQVARHVLLLSVSLEPKQQLGLLEKTRMFMELFGNTVVRPTTVKYLAKRARQFVDMVTSESYCREYGGIFDFSGLKFKERDSLETIFKFWSKPATFNMTDVWDKRIRRHLGVRYDAKRGVFDWDYHMRLCELSNNDGKSIFSREYLNWRETGVAFTWFELDGCKSNMTLAAGVGMNGADFYHLGYCGDISKGPYACYGMKRDGERGESVAQARESEQLRATDVTEQTLLEIFYQINENAKFPSEKIPTQYLGRRFTCETHVRIASDNGSLTSVIPNRTDPLLRPKNVQIKFVPAAFPPDKFAAFFDCVVAGNTTTTRTFDAIEHVLKVGGALIVETKRFAIVDVKKEEILIESQRLVESLSARGFTLTGAFAPLDDWFWRFRK